MRVQPDVCVKAPNSALNKISKKAWSNQDSRTVAMEVGIR